MINRRRFLKLTTAGGAGAYLTTKFSSYLLTQVPGGSLKPSVIPKFLTPLFIPPAMPRAASFATYDYYSIAVRQFSQQILPPSFPRTTVWSYGSVTDTGSFTYPSFTIEANSGRQVRVTWRNELLDSDGNYLPHLLPADQTLHWANPPGETTHRDMRSDRPVRV